MTESNPYLIKNATELEDVELKYANLFTRTASFAADITFALLACIPLVIFAMKYFVQNAQEGRILLPFYHFLFAPISVGVVFSVWVICAIFESSFGQGTPGKWVAGNAVVNGLGDRIGFYKAFGRQVIKYNFMLLIAVFPFVNVQIFSRLIIFVSIPMIVLNMYMILFNSEKQTFHDITASTYVIHRKHYHFLMPLIVLLLSIATSFSVVTWLKDKVILEAMSILPPGAQEAIVAGLIKGERDVVVKTAASNLTFESNSISASEIISGAGITAGSNTTPGSNPTSQSNVTSNVPSETHKNVKSIQISSAQTFEYVVDLIYKDAFSRDVGSIIAINTQLEEKLNTQGPVYTTMEYTGSYGYEFKTYLPTVPNLVINPNAFTLNINSAYDIRGSMLTPDINEATSIEERATANGNYLVVKKKVLFAQMAPVKKIYGAVTFRLPIKLQSETVTLSNPVKKIDIGAQIFQINSMTDKSIEFTHYGPAEYFLGVVAYEKGSPYPLIGSFKAVKNEAMNTTYTYEFDRSIAKYEFNTAVEYYFEKFSFSSNGSGS